jgi:hypothetical protein
VPLGERCDITSIQKRPPPARSLQIHQSLTLSRKSTLGFRTVKTVSSGSLSQTAPRDAQCTAAICRASGIVTLRMRREPCPQIRIWIVSACLVCQSLIYIYIYVYICICAVWLDVSVLHSSGFSCGCNSSRLNRVTTSLSDCLIR